MNQRVTLNPDKIPIVPIYSRDSYQNEVIAGSRALHGRALRRVFLISLLVLTGAGCVSVPPPENVENICSIFQEKEGWYEDVLAAEQKWGTPPPVLMAIVRHESRFVDDARPPMKTFFGIIPLGRPTTAYGYCQAVNGTWESYLEETGNRDAQRVNFEDAIDFVGWYTNVSFEKLGIPKWDGYNQYLAYHEGHVGYSQKSFNKKAWLLRVADKVQSTSELYAYQLKDCQEQLELQRMAKKATARSGD